MRPYKKVARILLILSAIKSALAAPIPVREIHEIRVHVLDIAGDRTTASQTRPDLSMNGAGWTNEPPSLGSSDSGHQWEQEQHNTRSPTQWEAPGPSNPEPPTLSPGLAGDDTHSLSHLPSSAQDEAHSLNPSSTHGDIDLNFPPSQHQGATDDSHALNPSSPHGHIDSSPPPNSGLTIDVRPQAHPDPLASSSAHDFIHSLFYSSGSESAPGSPHDTPPQAHPDPLASSSVHDYINSHFYSESAPGSPDTSQVYPDPLPSSSAHGFIHSPSFYSPSSEPTSPLAHEIPPQAYPSPVAGSSAQNLIDFDSSSSTSSKSTPGSPFDTPPQAHPDPVAGLSAQNFIDLDSSSSTSSESTPGSPLDTPPQAHPDPVAGSSAQNLIDLVSSSSSSSESTPGSPLATHPQAHSDPLTPSSAHDSAMVDLEKLLKTPFLSAEEYPPVPPSNPGPSTGSHPPPLAQSPDEDSEMVDLEHPPPTVPSNPGPSTGLHTLPSAQSPNEDSLVPDLDTLMKNPILSTEEYAPLGLGPTDNHPPPASPSNPGPSTGSHPPPLAQSPDENSEMVDLEHPPPAVPSNSGPSTGLHTLSSAQSPNEDSLMLDLDTLMKNPFLSTEKYAPLSLGPTDNHPPPASPSNSGPSTGSHPPPPAQSPDENYEMVESEHPPPAVPSNPGPSTGLHTLPSAQSPKEDSLMPDLDTLMKNPFLSTEEYAPLSLGPTDNHPSPSNSGPSTGSHPPPLTQPPDENSEMVESEHPPTAVPSNPGPSTGLHTLPSAQSPNEDSLIPDLNTLMKKPFLSTEEYAPLSLVPTDNHPPPAPPSNPGLSTEPNPPPSATRPGHEDYESWKSLSKIFKGKFKRRFSGSGALNQHRGTCRLPLTLRRE